MIRYLAPPDMQLPEEDARRWVQTDVAKLIEEAPVPVDAPNPMMPGGPPIQIKQCSVQPNPDLLKDYWDQAIEVVVVYGLKEGGQLLKDFPDGFDNLMLYLEKLRMLQQAAMAPPPMMPPPAKSAAAGPDAPNAPGPPAGAPTPGPVPPQPGATPTPMSIM